jgi:uncharacterized protein YegL
MKQNLTEIIFILDRSGSMGGLEQDTIGGYNAFLERQKGNGEALISTVLFSNRSEVIHDRVPIDAVKPLTEKEYYVGGSTALLDAIGSAVHHIANVHKYARKEDVPEKTVVVITTDGMENASRRYDYAGVRKLVERQKETHGWEFLFLGANMDAISAAAQVGIEESHAVRYHSDSAGTRLNFQVLSDSIVSFRKSSHAITEEWKEAIEQDYRSR